jgi:hypothetical protein
MMDISKASAMAVAGTRMMLSSVPHRQQRFSIWKITSNVCAEEEEYNCNV